MPMRFRAILRRSGRLLAGTAVLALLLGLVAVIGLGVVLLWQSLKEMSPDLAGALIAAAATVLVATVTIMLGRRHEKARDIEAHFRSAKIEMYDEFLKELFRLFQGGTTGESLVPFLREWQRKLVLWGGADVLRTYFKWKSLLKSGSPTAQSIFAMDEFFRALRKDIGQGSFGLEKGAFAHLILRHAEVLLAAARDNPTITLAEVSDLERKLGLEK